MHPRDALDSIILPTYRDVLPGRFASDAANVMLLAIGLQESRLEFRRQFKGPARGLWQFERGGGVQGVLQHNATRRYAMAVCVLRDVPYVAADVYEKLEHDDLLACAFARLLLFSDPRPLPPIGDADEAWGYYVRNWRPGKPHPITWAAFYRQAVDAVTSVEVAA